MTFRSLYERSGFKSLYAKPTTALPADAVVAKALEHKPGPATIKALEEALAKAKSAMATIERNDSDE